ncbi:MAG: hypothetical protein Q8862_14610 [Bacteroidota bacterium]|nr:hypothetical protein [Bacteroidota bacterium]
MKKKRKQYRSYLVAIAFGFLVALLDVFVLKSNVSSKIVLFLLMVGGVIVTLIDPQHPWLKGILVGIWVPLFNLLMKVPATGFSFTPDTLVSKAILFLVAIGVAIIGAYIAILIKGPPAKHKQAVGKKSHA